MKLRQASALAVAVLLAAGAAYIGLNWRPQEKDRPAAYDLSPAAFYATAYPDPSGQMRSFAQWQGKIIILNFWATWCQPCREEIPGLIHLHEKRRDTGVVVVGLALDDRDKVEPYVRELGISYPILLAGWEATDLGKRMGNPTGGLPFTVVLDQKGKIVAHHLGLVSEAQLSAMLAKVKQQD
jgi:thiol-disulfide isomerase/thioredoxin